MSERGWTKPQSDAIEARGGSVLVSAAAGSGKTAVLVERVIRMLCDEREPVSADRLLVVTFSNAAAAEMKQRIGVRLSAMISQNPENTFLQRQQALLQGAQISTIHAFCLELIRQNFQHLDISPDFVLADENEMAMMEQDCARVCVEEFYGRDDSGQFARLVELLSSGRDDARLIETILRIWKFSRSHPFYEDWLDRKLGMYDPGIPVEETVWGGTILRYAGESLGYCRRMLEEALELAKTDPAVEKGYGEALASDLIQVEDCISALEHGGWDAAVLGLKGFEFRRLGAVRGADAVKNRAKSMRERCKKIIGDLRDRYLSATGADFRGDIEDLRPKIELLFDLVKTFGQTLWRLKGDKRRLDFSDLEHLALRLLVERDGHSFRRTTRAEEIAACYAVVMVDEYQDTNEVQDMIFSSVSDNQRNLFMVGDVKQSIYGFRQAMPEIFLRKKQVFFPYGTGQYPARIILDTNFRSRDTVTGAVNHFFSLLMSPDIGEMLYTEEESLKCGAAYPQYPGALPELLLLEKSAEDATQAEARAVAGKIAAMLRQGYRVTEGEEMRPAGPGDFCILMRSPRTRAESYVQALLRLGIPAFSDAAGGFLETREVSMVVALLKALDNPLLDIELVAALMSPLFGFTDDDIARVRLTRRGAPFFTALSAAAQEGDGQAAGFLETFRQLRTEAAVLPADKLLLRLYDLTDALPVVQAMRLGENRVANLQLLVEYATTYHKLGYKRLGGFVGFLTRLEERGSDLAPAGASEGAAGAVRILSIHRSKGLEFPVVILADTFRQFNKVDLHAGTLLHSSLGFACVRRDEETLRQFGTIPMQAIRLESERSLLSEELRILYVALTRAREKLIISGVARGKLEKRLSDLRCVLQEGRLPSYAVREGNCYADWILMALLHHPAGAPLRELAGEVEEQSAAVGDPWTITVQPPASADELDEKSGKTERTAMPDPAVLERLVRSAAFRYPYESQTRVPTKLAVSTVAKGKQDLSYRFSSRPKFLRADGLTGAERGNALHKFMQFADYRQAKEDLPGEIQRMRDRGFLTREETDSLQLPRLRGFFDGPLAGRIFRSKGVRRELKFAAECGQDLLGDFLADIDSEGKVVLQGVADCVFFEEDGAVILDYKTDRVKSEAELADKYAAQLRLYRLILSRALEVPVKECLLYSFSLGRSVEIY